MSIPQSIGILTSGGDAPGMNAAVRAAVRTALYYGMKVHGVRRGYQGLIEGDVFEMQTTDVSNIIGRGGTVLKTARSKDFQTEAGMQKAYDTAQRHGIEALVIIGGNGTFRGALAFEKAHGIPAIGLPGTIDRDLAGTDATIGFDTAVNTAVEAIDRLRDTADAHDRLFVVEVMGRDAGYIALDAGIACGAEDILIPETKTDPEAVLHRIAHDERRKKTVHILVVAEGDDVTGGSAGLVSSIKERFRSLDVRHTVLGHIQRGGSPTCTDRVLASRLGHAAVEALKDGRRGEMVGLVHDAIAYTRFEEAVKVSAGLPEDLLQMIRVLST
jgi:6-phosphofructokinase 1